MADPFTAMTITTTVLKVVTTSITTAQTISNYVSKFNMADIQIAAMISECSAISHALRELQKIMIQDDPLRQTDKGSLDEPLAYVQTDYRGYLSECMLVFTVLDERLEKLNVRKLNKRSKSSAKAKIRTVWNGDAMQTTRDNIRGQVQAISFLLNTFQVAATARNTMQIEKQTAMIAGNSKETAEQSAMLKKIYQILTQDQTATLKNISADARSLSITPAARRAIEANEDAQSIFGGEDFFSNSPLEGSEVYRRSAAGKTSPKDKGKRRAGQAPEFENHNTDSNSVASSQDTDRFSFVTARIVPSIRTFLRPRNISQSTPPQKQEVELRPISSPDLIMPVQTPPQETPENDIQESHESSDTDQISENRSTTEQLLRAQKERWDYLTRISHRRIELDQTIDQYEETEMEFEERASALKAQIAGKRGV